MNHAILVVGAGAIARRHIANIRTLAPSALITVMRQRILPDDEGLRDPGIRVVRNLDDALLMRHTAAVVASPAPTHLPYAMRLADARLPMLVEKPLSHSLRGTSELLDACASNDVPLLVGYNLRFMRTLRRLRVEVMSGTIGAVQFVRAEVGQHLAQWRPSSDYRMTVTAQRRLGGGPLLELSHEIDYLRWIFGEVDEVRGWVGTRGDLEMDVDDLAELILQFGSGVTGSVHLDLLRTVPSRWCRVDGSRGSLTWDGLACRVELLEPGRPPAVLEESPGDASASYLAEMQHFLDCVEGRTAPLVDGQDAARTLAVVSAAAEAAIRPGIRP